jgi:uncharacterized protein
MEKKELIDDFLAQPLLAVAGVSRDTKKFGRTVYKDLKHKGYRVFAINPTVDTILGDPCYPNLAALPEKPGGVVTVVPPEATEKLVREAAQLGIARVWMQQGSESPNAIEFCQKNGIQVVYGECIMMFAVAGFPHNVHKWVNQLTGKLPK